MHPNIRKKWLKTKTKPKNFGPIENQIRKKLLFEKTFSLSIASHNHFNLIKFCFHIHIWFLNKIFLIFTLVFLNLFHWKSVNVDICDFWTLKNYKLINLWNFSPCCWPLLLSSTASSSSSTTTTIILET